MICVDLISLCVCVYSEGQSEGADMWRSLTEGMDVWDWEFWPS